MNTPKRYITKTLGSPALSAWISERLAAGLRITCRRRPIGSHEHPVAVWDFRAGGAA